MTVIRKAMPKPKPVSLKSLRLIGVLEEIFGDECSSSDVTSTTTAVIASQRLMSDNVRGKFIVFSLALF